MATVLKPKLSINGHDYAKYILDLEPSRNDLDAEGSGRDTQTGLMYRVRIAQKAKLTVKMGRLPQTIHKQLLADINPIFYQATYVDPNTGSEQTKYFYTAETPFGSQRYDRETGKPYYVGMTFDMTER